MKKLIALSFFFLFVSVCQLRGQWTVQPSGTTQNLTSVSMVSANLGWIVGTSGTILKYNGTSWLPQSSVAAVTLNSVHAVDATHAWAVGNGGTILMTTDGVNWIPQASPTTQNLNCVFFTDATHGWAVGDQNVAIKTTDGLSWTLVTIPESTGAGCSTLKSFKSVYLNGNYGIIVGGNSCGGGGAIFLTTNGGTDWVFNTTGINYPSDMNTGFVVSSTNIWATSYAKGSSGLHQYNGTSWTEITINGSAMRPNTVYFSTTTQGWLVDGNGKIFSNATTPWSKVYDGNSVQLNSIKFANSNYGWAVGNTGVILMTTNGGLLSELEAIKTDPFVIYPKKGDNYLFIQNVSENSHVSICDVAGKIMKIKLIDTFKIDIHNLKNGIYILKIDDNGNQITRKFTKL